MNGTMTSFLKSGYGTWYPFYSITFGGALISIIVIWWKLLIESIFFAYAVWTITGLYFPYLLIFIEKVNL